MKERMWHEFKRWFLCYYISEIPESSKLGLIWTGIIWENDEDDDERSFDELEDPSWQILSFSSKWKAEQ
jgi:hypothetical protein